MMLCTGYVCPQLESTASANLSTVPRAARTAQAHRTELDWDSVAHTGVILYLRGRLGAFAPERDGRAEFLGEFSNAADAQTAIRRVTR